MRICVLGANGFLGRYFLSKHPNWIGDYEKGFRSH